MTLEAIHRYSYGNKNALGEAVKCGCFYCEKIYPPAEINEWIPEKDGGETAVCPHCRIDSVLPDLPEIELSADLLSRMESHFFGFKKGEKND